MNAPNRIKELRKSMAMKQEELARRCGVKQGAVSAWESGLSNPKPEALRVMSQLFNVSIGYILGIEGELPEHDIDNIDLALLGEIREMTEAEKLDMLDLMRFRRAQRIKRQQEGRS